jgi:hypothetical protein
LEVFDLSPDDLLHAPTDDDRWWSETYWFSFDIPEHKISGHFYPMFRRNIGVSSLSVMVWQADTDAPWTAPYFRTNWHLPLPDFANNSLSLDKMRYEILETQRRFRVTYDDPGLFRADIEFTGCMEPFDLGSNDVYHGHIDQPMKVTGEIELHGHKLKLDCHGMRDRSWGPRSDEEDGARALYIYGISDRESFLIIKMLNRNPAHTVGFLYRDGLRGNISDMYIRRVDGAHGRADIVELKATDSLGRSLDVTGRTKNHFAMQANPHQFAWISMIEWGQDAMYGEFQEVMGRRGLAEHVSAHFKL